MTRSGTVAGCFFFVLSTAAVAQPLDEDFLPVPGGRRMHKSCIHKVPDGAEVHDRKAFINGIEVAQFPVCQFAPRHHLPAPTINGWARFSFANPLSSPGWWNDIQSRWTVPSAPLNTNPHLLYFFNGFQGTGGSFDHIIQPVLQFGQSPAGGGAYWAMANWLVGPDVVLYHQFTTVSVGAVITGRVQIYPGFACPANGIGCKWQVEFKVNSGSWKSSIFQWGSDRFNQAFGAVLEMYSVTACAMLPANGSIVFTHDWLSFAGPTAFTKNYTPTCYADNNSAALSPSCSLAVSTSACPGTITSTISWAP